ncbi:MAG: hypothetical protein WC343_02085 [Bacilli bacterium]|jgi:DNA polymerase-3 subunit delta'
MLDSYCNEQSNAYNIIKNTIKSNRIDHAYLFCADYSKIAFEFALSFAKTLMCPKSKFNNKDCGDCSICHRIDNNNFPELKIIMPEGLWIKKNQLLELQEIFSMKALEGNKKVYLIKDADQLNSQAANSILKFLEEPEENIIAILTTGDMRSILPTIISRCQVINLKGDGNPQFVDTIFDNLSNTTLGRVSKLKYQTLSDAEAFISEERNKQKLDAIVSFAKSFEKEKTEVLIDIKKLWFDYFTEKDDYIWAFDMLGLFYMDVINYMYGRKLELFIDYIDTITFVALHNKADNVIYKLQKIILMKEKIKYNLNLNLLMDKLLIEMERGMPL